MEAPSGGSPEPGPSPNSGIFDGSGFFTGSNDVYRLSWWGKMGLEFLVTTIAQITVVLQDLILGYSLFLRNVRQLLFGQTIFADYLSLI